MPRRKITIDHVRDEFNKRGFTLLSDTYINSKQKFDYICPNKHKHNIRFDHFMNGHGCPYCAGRPIIKIEDVKVSFEKEGYTLLSDTYINSSTKLDYRCNKGHERSITWSNWYTGYRCPACAGKEKKDINFIREEFDKEGYVVLSNNYENHHGKIECVCVNGHEYSISWSNWQKGARCPKCNDIGISKPEYEICNFLNDLNINYIQNDRKIIAPYELDVVIPDKKIAIEYCGLYWHSELMGKDRNYHFDKLNACKEKGYRLITIFEDEFISNKDIVLSRLNVLLGVSSETIYARKCTINEIDTKQARIFCDNNHLQRYTGSSIKLGAFYNNELVSIMTFSKASISKGSKHKEGVWELSRFCSKINLRVVGIASKLLKYFERNYSWNKIFSYADRRWSDGNLYEKIGFDYISDTKPNYWYFKKNTKRLHRFGLRKSYKDSKDITEWELRVSQGWNRIWDCGNLKFEKVKNI
jgi:hypothetical protein